MLQKIRLRLEGEVLDAYMAITAEFESCGKAAHFPERTMKLTDDAFRCVYKGVVRATKNETRYPTKSGKEYKSLNKLIEIMENEYYEQRGIKFYL